jgi:hypothetical protein
MSKEGLVHRYYERFCTLGVQAQLGEANFAAPLAALVGDLREHSAAANKSDPTVLLIAVRGRIKFYLKICESPEAALPDKLNDPANQRLVIFLGDAIRLLDEAANG